MLALAVLAAIEGTTSKSTLRKRIIARERDVPVDVATGMLDHRGFEQRVYGEIKRAVRFGGNVWVGVWAVTEGDADAFGREAASGLVFPEIGFRLSPSLFCFVRPNVDHDRREALVARVSTAAARHVRAARGEALHSAAGGKIEARRVLDQALQDLLP